MSLSIHSLRASDGMKALGNRRDWLSLCLLFVAVTTWTRMEINVKIHGNLSPSNSLLRSYFLPCDTYLWRNLTLLMGIQEPNVIKVDKRNCNS